MKIMKITDTHYGFSRKTHKIHMKFLQNAAHVAEKEGVHRLLHTGDWIANNQHQLPRTWRMHREYFGNLPIDAVLGNHDLWNDEIFNVPLKKRIYAKRPDLCNYDAIVTQQKDWAAEYKINLLNDNPVETHDWVIYGFNGWYHAIDSGSTDLKRIPPVVQSCPTNSFLANKAHKELDEIIELARYETRKKMLVTHMPPYTDKLIGLLQNMCANPRFLEFIVQHFDVFCFGHTHFKEEKWIEEVIGNTVHRCRFINAGTEYCNHYHGYDRPRYQIIEV